MNKVRKNSSKANSLAAKPQKENFWCYYLIIFLCTFLLYSNTIPNTFSFDDDYVTYHNAQIKKGFKGIPEILTTRYSLKENHTFGYRPVAKVTYAAEYQLFGENPHASHFLNIIFYALCGIFLFILLKKIFSKYNSFVLLVCTLLFLAHPVHTEVVASLKNREDIFSFLFSILSLITLINYIRKKKLISLIFSILLFILAILSKLNAATFVLVIPLALYYAFDDIKIHFSLKAFPAPLRLKQKEKDVILKVKSHKKNTKQKNYKIGQGLLKWGNILRHSVITKKILLIHFFTRFIISFYHFFIEHLFFIGGLAAFILISYFTKVTLPWLISSVVGIHFLTRESKYNIRDIIKSKYFTGILFLLSFVFFVNLNVIRVLPASFKKFMIILPLILTLLIIKILSKNDKKEKKLLIDFFSNKYLVLFHFIYLILGLVSLAFFEQFNFNAIISPLIVLLVLIFIMIVYSWFIKTKTLVVLNNNRWLITGLCLFISHVNVYSAANLFMIREILYLISLSIVCLIFYFERASLKLILTKSGLPLKFIVSITESFIKKTNLMMSKIKRGLLNLLLVYIPKPLKKLFLNLKKQLPALPKPFVFIYKESKKVYITLNPYFKLLIIVSVVFVIIAYFSIKTPDRYLPPEKIKGAVTILQNPLHFEQNTGNRSATGFSVLFFYLKKTIFPHPLLFYYGYNMVPVVGWKNFTAIISLIIHLLLIAFAIAGIKRKSIFSFAILFYLISISIFSNLVVPVNGIVGERFLFVPSLGWILILVFLIFKIFKTDVISVHFNFRKNIKPLTLLFLIFVLYSYKTIDRNMDWKDHLRLYSSDIKYLENSARANVIYAGTMYGELFPNLQPGQDISPEQMYKAELIVKHYKQGLKIDPTYSNAWNNLGITYVLICKSIVQGINCFENAIKYDSTDCETYFNLGYAYELLHDSTRAEQSYRKSLDINFQYPKSFMALNNLLMKQHRYKDVADINSRLMKANPGLDIPYINLGNIFLEQSDTSKCLENWEKAFHLNPENISNCTNLAGMFQLRKNFSKSSYYSEQISKIREKYH